MLVATPAGATSDATAAARFRAFAESAEAVSDAALAVDFPALRSACRDMRKDAQAILGYSRPPAYSPESWRHARAGMRLFVKASDRCVSAARAKNVAALKSVVAISGRGSAELRVATALAKR